MSEFEITRGSHKDDTSIKRFFTVLRTAWTLIRSWKNPIILVYDIKGEYPEYTMSYYHSDMQMAKFKIAADALVEIYEEMEHQADVIRGVQSILNDDIDTPTDEE